MTTVRRLDEGGLRTGSEARVKQPRLPETTWRVTALEPGVDFTWESTSPGAHTVAGHRITRRGDRASTVTLSIDQHGPIAALLNLFIAGMTRRYIGIEAACLKSRCERGESLSRQK